MLARPRDVEQNTSHVQNHFEYKAMWWATEFCHAHVHWVLLLTMNFPRLEVNDCELLAATLFDPVKLSMFIASTIIVCVTAVACCRRKTRTLGGEIQAQVEAHDPITQQPLSDEGRSFGEKVSLKDSLHLKSLNDYHTTKHMNNHE